MIRKVKPDQMAQAYLCFPFNLKVKNEKFPDSVSAQVNIPEFTKRRDMLIYTFF